MYSRAMRIVKAMELPDGGSLRINEEKTFISYWNTRAQRHVQRVQRILYTFHRYNPQMEFMYWVDPGGFRSKEDALKMWRKTYASMVRRVQAELKDPDRRSHEKKDRTGTARIRGVPEKKKFPLSKMRSRPKKSTRHRVRNGPGVSQKNNVRRKLGKKRERK